VAIAYQVVGDGPQTFVTEKDLAAGSGLAFADRWRA